MPTWSGTGPGGSRGPRTRMIMDTRAAGRRWAGTLRRIESWENDDNRMDLMTKRVAKSASRRLFSLSDRLGLHILPAHYYSPVAHRKLLRSSEPLWRRPTSLVGVKWDLDGQAAWLQGITGDYPSEMTISRIMQLAEAVGGFRYGPIEAQFLHAYIRRKGPRRIVEIGSGSSTVIMSQAVERNVGEGRSATEIIAIDPYMRPEVGELPYVTVRKIGGLELEADDLGLQAGDLLFIDSTHAVKTGSEVPHLYLDIVPRMPPGVCIHIHDIYLPYLYGPNLYDEFFDWQETALVAALLTGNPRLGVLASLSALHHDRPDVLRAAFPEYQPMPVAAGIATEPGGHFPSPLWLQVAEGS
jgi:hypothetical protein